LCEAETSEVCGKLGASVLRSESFAIWAWFKTSSERVRSGLLPQVNRFWVPLLHLAVRHWERISKQVTNTRLFGFCKPAV
jgi:hypothetical protein